MEEELECVVCLELYRDPVLLPCSSAHSLCLNCALSPPVLTEGSVKCPVCQEVTPLADARELKRNIVLRNVIARFKLEQKERISSAAVRDGGAAPRDANGHPLCMCCPSGEEKIAALECASCRVLYCEGHRALHPNTGVLAAHMLVPVQLLQPGVSAGTTEPEAQLPAVDRCERHADQRLELFCTTCNVLVCNKCLTVGPHTEHTRMSIDKAAVQERTRLQTTIHEFEAKEAECVQFCGKIRILQQKIRENRQRLDSTIDAAFVQLQEELTKKRAQMLDHVKMVEEFKTSMLQLQSEQQVKIQQRFERMRERATSVLKDEDHLRFIRALSALNQRMNLLFSSYTAPTLVIPYPQLELTFYPLQLIKEIREFNFEELQQTLAKRRDFEVGQWIDCRDAVQRWNRAVVVEVLPKKKQIKVHYEGWSAKWDEWLDMTSPRIAPFSLVTRSLPPGDLKGPGPKLGDLVGNGRVWTGSYADLDVSVGLAAHVDVVRPLVAEAMGSSSSSSSKDSNTAIASPSPAPARRILTQLLWTEDEQKQ